MGKRRQLIFKLPAIARVSLYVIGCLEILCFVSHIWLAMTNIEVFAKWDRLLTVLTPTSVACFFGLLGYTLFRYGRLEDLD